MILFKQNRVVLIALVLAWVALVMIALAEEPPEPLINDALVPPDIAIAQSTSEVMTGTVAVAIILPESNGGVDESTENWTHAERWHVHNEIVDALNWWAAREPRANLAFVIEEHYVSIGFEPISRPHSDIYIWIEDILRPLGYENPPSYFSRMRDFNDDLKERHQTDRAFTIFVVDSSNDPDNLFSNGVFAYGYLGGPFMVMTYGNNGYGPGNMDMVCAHEMGHVFHALDQYSGARVLCSYGSGCANVLTRNSDYRPVGKDQDCVSREPSIMKWAPYAYPKGLVDKWARGQVGWWDADLDGVFECENEGEPLRIFLPVIMR